MVDDIKTLENWIKNLFKGSQIEVITVGEGFVEVNLNDYYDFTDQFIEFERQIEQHGWYITRQDGIEDMGDEAALILHKIDNEEVDVPHFIYHRTSLSAATKAVKEGIKLSRGGIRHGFKYPPRAFFTRNPDDAQGMDLGLKGEQVVLKVDTSKVPGIQLFMDPEFYGEDKVNWDSAYSKRGIPADAVEMMTLKKNEVKFVIKSLVEQMVQHIITNKKHLY